MNLAHLHLILNHLPLIGLFIGFFVLAWGVIRGYAEVRTTGLWLLLLTSLIAIPVYLTGEPAEEIVEKLPGVSEQYISLHEDSAMYSLILSIAAGALALFALVAKRYLSASISLVSVYVVMAVSLVAGASMAYTANLGGEVRHTEIRQQQMPNTNSGTKQTEGKKDDDDR